MPRPTSHSDNGASVIPFEEETTDEHNLRLISGAMDLADSSSEIDPMTQLVESIAEAMSRKQGGGGGGTGGDGGGSGHGPIDIRKFRKGNWWVQAAIGVMIAGAGAFAAYKATEARSVSNEAAIGDHEKLPAHPAAQEEFRLIRVDIADINDDLDGIEQQGADIAAGVEQLKQEAQTTAQTRLEEKVKELERENRRLGRDR